jgi:lipoprotein LpqH
MIQTTGYIAGEKRHKASDRFRSRDRGCAAVKRLLPITVAGTAIVVAALAGCSSVKSGASSSTNATNTKVLIDGQDQNVKGHVVCSTTAGAVVIAIGGAATGVGAKLSDGNPPRVQSVGLGNVNGVALGYQSGVGQGNAQATKDGNTYKITGTATGVDMSNPMQPLTKPFEIDVTCP